MADIVDSCCVQLTRPDKNNNTTTTINDEIISPIEQCDVPQSEIDGKSENLGGTDDRPLSSSEDALTTETTNIASPSNDETDLSPSTTSTVNVANSYKDFSGIDTESFIATTLRNNPKDRTLLLTLENVLQQFIQDEEQISHQFQSMNSYERMIVHRVAAFFGLDHNVDKNGQSVVVTKTANTRIPDFLFENFIPSDELPNGATPPPPPPTTTTTTILNSPVENTTRRISRRNDKHPNQYTFTTKPSFERANNSVETRDKIPNKVHRKPQRAYTNYHLQQANIQPSGHTLNTRNQPVYASASTSYYPQQPTIDYNLQQQITGSPMYNYVPMIPSQHGNGIQLPIFLQQQPTGQFQYVFPTHSLPQAPQLSSDGQYMPIYRSDLVPSVADNNNSYSQQPFVHLYPTHPYTHTPQTTYVQSAPSFMIPPNNGTSIQYATNQFATLSLQSQYDTSRFSQSNNPINFLRKPLVQSTTNGLTRMPIYQQYRQTRPLNTNNTDKQLIPIENDIKSTNNNSDQISLAESVQEKD